MPCSDAHRRNWTPVPHLFSRRPARPRSATFPRAFGHKRCDRSPRTVRDGRTPTVAPHLANRHAAAEPAQIVARARQAHRAHELHRRAAAEMAERVAQRPHADTTRARHFVQRPDRLRRRVDGRQDGFQVTRHRDARDSPQILRIGVLVQGQQRVDQQRLPLPRRRWRNGGKCCRCCRTHGRSRTACSTGCALPWSGRCEARTTGCLSAAGAAAARAAP